MQVCRKGKGTVHVDFELVYELRGCGLRRALQLIVCLLAIMGIIGLFVVAPDAWAYVKFQMAVGSGSNEGEHCVDGIERQLTEQSKPIDYEQFRVWVGPGIGLTFLGWDEDADQSRQTLESYAILKSAVKAGELISLDEFAEIIETGNPSGIISQQVEIIYRERVGTDSYGLRRATTVLYDTRHCIHGYTWIEQLTGKTSN